MLISPVTSWSWRSAHVCIHYDSSILYWLSRSHNWQVPKTDVLLTSNLSLLLLQMITLSIRLESVDIEITNVISASPYMLCWLMTWFQLQPNCEWNLAICLHLPATCKEGLDASAFITSSIFFNKNKSWWPEKKMDHKVTFTVTFSLWINKTRFTRILLFTRMQEIRAPKEIINWIYNPLQYACALRVHVTDRWLRTIHRKVKQFTTRKNILIYIGDKYSETEY